MKQPELFGSSTPSPASKASLGSSVVPDQNNGPGPASDGQGMKSDGLPVGWVATTVGELASVIAGTGFPKRYQGKASGDYPFMKVRDISEAVVKGRTYIDTANNYVSETDCKEMKGTPLPAGCTVFAKIGEAIRLNRRVILGCDALVDNNVFGVRPSSGINREFLYYFLHTIRFGDTSRATTVPSLRKGDVEDVPLSIPPLPEQRRIVDKIEELFTNLDAGVAGLKKVQAQLKRYRASVLKAACEGKLVPTEAELARQEGRDYEPADILLQRVQQERRRKWEEAELAKLKAKGKAPVGDAWKKKYKEPAAVDTTGMPDLPEGWVWTTIDHIGQTIGGLTKNRKRAQLPDQMPYLRVANVYANELRLDDVSEIGVADNELSKLLLEEGDLLVVEGNGSKEHIGRLALWDGSISPCVHQNHLIKVRLFEPQFRRFCLWWYLSPEGRNVILRVASSTSGLYTLSVGKVSVLPVPVPPLAEQHRIVAEVERRLSIIDNLEATLESKLAQSGRLRQSILKRAFEGKLVPQDPNDEPATILLDRIKQERQAAAAKAPTRGRRRKTS